MTSVISQFLREWLTMKKSTYVAFGLVAGLGGAAILGALPASAYTEITSFTISPSTFRGGDEITLTVNGQTSGQFSYSGCTVALINGEVYTAGDYSPTNPPIEAGTVSSDLINMYGDDLLYQGMGYAGACSTIQPTDTPAWVTNVMTITPQLVIDPVELAVGSAGSVEAGYTTASPGGESPFNWSGVYGGVFQELDPSECTPTLGPVSLADSELPAGVTISDVQSPSGSAPSLVLEGAPDAGSEGTYKVCVEIQDSNGMPSAGWLNITVSAALPATGLDGFVMAVAAGFAGLLVIAGAMVLVLRRRATA
jgi:hypothetical protein